MFTIKNLTSWGLLLFICTLSIVVGKFTQEKSNSGMRREHYEILQLKRIQIQQNLNRKQPPLKTVPITTWIEAFNVPLYEYADLYESPIIPDLIETFDRLKKDVDSYTFIPNSLLLFHQAIMGWLSHNHLDLKYINVQQSLNFEFLSQIELRFLIGTFPKRSDFVFELIKEIQKFSTLNHIEISEAGKRLDFRIQFSLLGRFA